MSKLDTAAMDVKSSVAAGNALDVSAYSQKSVQVTGTFNATLQIEGTIDGTNWEALLITNAPGEFDIDGALFKMRVNTTAYTSGTPAVMFAGFETRTV